MPFDLASWKQAAVEKLGGIGDWLRRRGEAEAPYLLYGALCGCALWPLIEAARADISFSP